MKDKMAKKQNFEPQLREIVSKKTKNFEKDLRELVSSGEKDDIEDQINYIIEKSKANQLYSRSKQNTNVNVDLDGVVKAYEHALEDESLELSDFEKVASGLVTDARTIQDFVNVLSEYKGHRFGPHSHFLSGLVNNCTDEYVLLDVTNFKYKMDFLGSSLDSHTLHIIGNVKDLLGWCMSSGNIILDGDADSEAGYNMTGGGIFVRGNVKRSPGRGMSGGKMVIFGDAEENVGVFMKEGIIIVYGHAGRIIGMDMEGGEIYLNGTYESLSKQIKDGEIYRKGKRIFPK